MAFVLRIFDAESKTVRVHEVSTSSVKLGRADTCDVVLDSPYVSREHAVVRQAEGKFVLESVGKNVTSVNRREIAQGAATELQPDDEIQIAGFSIFIEGQDRKKSQSLDPAAALGEIELAIHARVLERVDLHAVASGAGDANARLRQVLDEAVRLTVPDVATTTIPPEVIRHALHESLYGETVGDVLRRAASAGSAGGTQGFLAKMDRMLGEVVDKICRNLGLAGGKARVREDLALVDAGFDAQFARFEAESSAESKTLFVQRFLTREILNLICGFGPLQDLLELPNTSEIMVVDKDLIYIEREGRLQRLRRTFISDSILLAVIQRIVEPLGRLIDRSTPLVDARLPDGSRVNAIIPPLAVKGPCLTIRRFSKDPLRPEDLVRYGSLTAPAVEFLKACVKAHKNILISGGTGSGKTTMLNVLSGFIGDDERIVTIEDSAELQLRQTHVVTLETRPPNVEGKGAYTIRDLVKNALRMRPDRIVVGECRGAEALEMLQAMNTGHDGSLTTLHANTPDDALLRLETMVLQAADLPVRAIRDQIEAAIHLIVQCRRLGSGKRMVTHIAEVVGVDPVEGVVVTNNLFEERDGVLRFTGYLPSFIDALVKPGYLDPVVLFAREATPAKPDAAKPDAAKPDAAKPDAAKPDAAKPDAAKPDAKKPAPAPSAPGKAGGA